MWQQGLHQQVSTGYAKLTVPTTPSYPPFIVTAAVFKTYLAQFTHLDCLVGVWV